MTILFRVRRSLPLLAPALTLASLVAAAGCGSGTTNHVASSGGHGGGVAGSTGGVDGGQGGAAGGGNGGGAASTGGGNGGAGQSGAGGKGGGGAGPGGAAGGVGGTNQGGAAGGEGGAGGAGGAGSDPCATATDNGTCATEGQVCRQSCSDACSFCNIFTCTNKKWSHQEAFPAPCFTCGGGPSCVVGSQYCEAHLAGTSAGQNSYACKGTPTACLPTATCDCLASSTTGGFCQEAAPGKVQVTFAAP